MDRLGRKLSINVAVVIFVVGSAIQCGAVNVPMLFVGMYVPFLPESMLISTGRAIAGLAVGQLTMVVPFYISEVCLCNSVSRPA